MDIYKQICAKLVEAWDNTADGEYEDFGRAASCLVDWTRDALAEPEPEGPTDEELLQVFDNACLSEGGTVGEIHLRGLRTVLARWGNSSAPQPMPVSDPPKPEDCDAEGRCWWLIEPYPRPVGPSGKLWSLCRYCPGANYWLPARALPLPEEVE